MSGLYRLGEFIIRHSGFQTRKRAISNCIERTTDETRRATLEHALRRVKSEEATRELVVALTTPGMIHGRRTDFN